jgi:hypothetical protein
VYSAANVSRKLGVLVEKEFNAPSWCRFSEYYFSEENLNRDFYMRTHMDKEGFLPLSLIASFHRVQALTNDIAVIIAAIENSNHLEIGENYMVRTKYDPMRWPVVSNEVPTVNGEKTAQPVITSVRTISESAK